MPAPVGMTTPLVHAAKHGRAADVAALLPDGLRFVSGSWDQTACISYHGLAP